MDDVSLNFNDTNIKLVERSRGRMKIQIKFSKEEAEGFKNFLKIKPPEILDEEFYKQIFFAGCVSMSKQIEALVESHKAAEAEKAKNPVQEDEQAKE